MVSREEYEAWIADAWEPENIRAMLALAGCVLAAYELIKQRILGGVASFFFVSFDGADVEPELLVAYDRSVLARNRKSRFLASCDWLVEMEAITEEQVAILNELREVRQHVAHELPAFLVDPSYMWRPFVVTGRAPMP